MKGITLIQDVNIIKEHIKNEDIGELKRLCKLYLTEYNLKILTGLNKFEQDTWLRLIYS
jgi:hypothetical protein